MTNNIKYSMNDIAEIGIEKYQNGRMNWMYKVKGNSSGEIPTHYLHLNKKTRAN